MTSPFASDGGGAPRQVALWGVLTATLVLGGCATPSLAQMQADASALMRSTPEWFEAAAEEVSGRGYPSLAALPPEPAAAPTQAEWDRRLARLADTGRELNAVAVTDYPADAATLLAFARAQAARAVPPASPDPDLADATDIAAWAAAQRARVTRDDLDVQ
jgi:hypothetical protein